MRESHSRIEIAVGIFVIAGILALGYLSVSVAGLDLFPGDATVVHARFASVGELKQGAAVKMAGVRVGEVRTIRLEQYAAEADLAVQTDIDLPADTIASIRTAGLLGESYVLLRPGGSERNLKTGDRISQTEPAIDLIDLVVKYALDSADDEEDPGPADDPLSLDGDENEDTP